LGRPAAVVRPFTPISSDAISSINGGISMKLITNIYSVSGNWGTSFQGERSEVKNQGHICTDV